jgi:hypothetical protein
VLLVNNTNSVLHLSCVDQDFSRTLPEDLGLRPNFAMISFDVNPMPPQNDDGRFLEISGVIAPHADQTAISCTPSVGTTETIALQAEQTCVMSARRPRKPRGLVPLANALRSLISLENLEEKTKLSGKATTQPDGKENCDARLVGDVTARYFSPLTLIFHSVC